MICRMFSLKDEVTGLFSSPLPFANTASACRGFTDTLANPQSDQHRHPQDYSLFEIGTFDDNQGTFVMNSSPVRIMTGDEYLKMREVQK